MFRKLSTMMLVFVITGAALWGFQHVRFFEKLRMNLSLPALAANDFQAESRPQGTRGQRNTREFASDFGGTKRHGGGHAMPVSPAGWINVMAYFSIFAFFIMLTYYGERELCKVRSRK